MLNAVAFDLDGTLIDSTEAIVECFMLSLQQLHEPLPERDAVVGSISVPLEDQFALLTHRDPDLCAKVYRKFYREIGPRKTLLIPGARDCLEALDRRGLRLGFATSKLRAMAELVLEELEILAFFQSRIGPDDVVNPKPHPEALLKSMAELGADNDTFLFVGDTEFDLRAAKAAGVRCVGVTTGYRTRTQLEEENPDAIFDSLTEVQDYILDCLGEIKLIG